MSTRVALCALVLSGCDTGGWRVLDTGSEVRLQSVFVAASDRIIAAGDRGTILEYDGESVVETSTDADIGPRVPGFYAIVSSYGIDRVAGDDGTVLVRRGNEYEREDSKTRQRLLTMIAAAPSVLYAGGENGRVIRRSGGAWERIDVGVGDAKITGGWGNGASSVAFTTNTGFVIDQVGGEWVKTQVATGTSGVPLFDVWSSTAGADAYAVGLGGAIYERARGADEFTLLAAPAPGDLYAIYGTAPDRIWAVGATGAIVEWDGVEWRGVPSGTSEDLFSIHASDDGKTVAAAGGHGTIVVLREE